MSTKTKTKSTKTRNEAKMPKSMRHRHIVDKSKRLVLFSLKQYGNHEREDSTIIDVATQNKCKRAKSMGEFRRILRPFGDAQHLRIDSASTKLNLANHDRTRIGLYNVVARALGLMKFVKEYGTKKAKK